MGSEMCIRDRAGTTQRRCKKLSRNITLSDTVSERALKTRLSAFPFRARNPQYIILASVLPSLPDVKTAASSQGCISVRIPDLLSSVKYLLHILSFVRFIPFSALQSHMPGLRLPPMHSGNQYPLSSEWRQYNRISPSQGG